MRNGLRESRIRSFRTCFFSLVAFLGLAAAVAVPPEETTATADEDATSGRLESHEPAAEIPTAVVAAAGEREAARVNCLQESNRQAKENYVLRQADIVCRVTGCLNDDHVNSIPPPPSLRSGAG